MKTWFLLAALLLPAPPAEVSDMPAANLVRGRTGRTLSEAFEGSPKAHRGTTFAEFPNHPADEVGP